MNNIKQEPLLPENDPKTDINIMDKIKWIKNIHKRRKLVVQLSILFSLIITIIIFIINKKTHHKLSPMKEKHIIKLKCHQKANILSCKPLLQGGKFIIHSPSCDSLFEINGYPFNHIKSNMKDYYEVPFEKNGISIRDVESNCNINVYQHTSEEITITVPCITWVASKHIETFTLTTKDDDTILSEVPAEILMVDEKGPWRAFQFDINTKIKHYEFSKKKSKIYSYGCN